MTKLVNFAKKIDEPVTVALGFFDCVHEGHRKLLSSAKKLSEVLNTKLCVFTFANNPAFLFNPEQKLVNTFSERVQLLENSGADYILFAAFDETLKQKSADEFFKNLLRNDVRGIVCGFDFRFGHNAEAGIETLEKLCNENGVALQVQPQVFFKNKKMSTSLIKQFLAEGDLESAKACLGREYFLDGYVTAGHGKGKKLGFPTANIDLEPDKLLPKKGVYAGLAEFNGLKKKCVINVGTRPTFNDEEETVEAHILDFEGDLYFQKVRLLFRRYLRPTVKFDSEQELISQISRDIEDTYE